LLRTPGVVSISALTCQKRPVMGGGQRAIIPSFDSKWRTASIKALPARIVLKRPAPRLDSAGAGGAGGAKGEWDVVAGKWRSGNERSGRAWRGLRALAACARSFLCLVVESAPPLSASSFLLHSSWPSPLLSSLQQHRGTLSQEELETNMSRAPLIHASAMVVGRARNRPLHEWMQELIGCEQLMWQTVMSCALAFNHVRPERILPLLHIASGVAGASSVNWRHAARHAAGVQREGEGGGKERHGWTVVSSSCQGRQLPQQAPGVDSVHAKNAQRASEQDPQEPVVVWKFDSMEVRSMSSLVARGIFSVSKHDLQCVCHILCQVRLYMQTARALAGCLHMFYAHLEAPARASTESRGGTLGSRHALMHLVLVLLHVQV
jgi:hypothetical protein